MKRGLSTIVVFVTVTVIILVAVVYIFPEVTSPMPIPVNGSTKITSIEVKINEELARGPSLISDYSYIHHYLYSGNWYGPTLTSQPVAVFSILTPAPGNPGSIQFYVHIGESFIINGKVYTLKSINNGSVTLEVSNA